MNEEQDSNPEIEGLQRELNAFRAAPFQLSGSELEKTLQELIQKTAKGRASAFVFLGIPGGGKSKLIEKVARFFDVDASHVRDLVAKNPDLRRIEKEYYKSGEIIPGIEKEFLKFAFQSNAKQYLIDGFPRTIFQAIELYQYAAEKKLQIFIVEIRLQDKREMFQSFYRQQNRATHRIKKGVLFGQAEEEEQHRIIAKMKRALELDLYVIETLRALGANIIVLDATNGPSKMLRQFKLELGLPLTATD